MEEEESPDYDLVALNDPRSSIPMENKVALVAAYAVTGSLKKAASKTGINYETAKYWKNSSQWWDSTLQQVRKAKQDELDAKITSILDSCVEDIAGKLQTGDEVITKNGDRVFKQISAKDAAWIAGVLFDKRALIRGDPTSRSERSSKEEDMNKLMKRFEELASQMQGKTIEGEVIRDTNNGEKS